MYSQFKVLVGSVKDIRRDSIHVNNFLLVNHLKSKCQTVLFPLKLGSFLYFLRKCKQKNFNSVYQVYQGSMEVFKLKDMHLNYG